MDANPGTRKRARTLRRQTTLPEGLLWRELRSWKADGLHFRRQHPAGRYVLDFYCFTYRLAVEVDGAFHHVEGRQALDAARDRWLEAFGIRVLRLPASLVLKDMTTAVDMILHAVEQQREVVDTLSRSPPGELSAHSDD